MGRYKLRERSLELLPSLSDLSEKVLFLDHVNHRQAGATGERISTKSTRVCTGREALSDLIGTEHRPDRHPTSEALREGHNIGFYAVNLVRKPCPSPTDSGLDLIKNEQDPGLVTERAKAL